MATRIPFVLRADDGTLSTGIDLSAGGVVQVSLDQGGSWVNRAGAAPVETGGGAYYYELDPTEVVSPWVLVKIALATYQTVIEREFVSGAGSLNRIPFVLRADDGTLTSGVDLSGAGVVQVSADHGATWTNRAGAAPHSTGAGAYYYQLDATELVQPWVLLKVALATYQTVIQREDRATAGLAAPTISNRTPALSTTPGALGGFSSVFAVARDTPIEMDLSGIPAGAVISASVRYTNRLETYVALGIDGAFVWPFDIQTDNTIGDLSSSPTHLKLFPRGGWPPCNVEVIVGAAIEATG